MPAAELAAEIAAGVDFWGEDRGGRLSGIVGLQMVGDVALIRHAYVRPAAQRNGVGTRLMKRVLKLTERPVLVGTWAASTWAIDFYEDLGFTLASDTEKTRLLKKYWSIPERQVDTSVGAQGATPGPGVGARRIMAKVYTRTFEWRFDQPPEALWPALGDTARFNEAAGIPKHTIEEALQDDGRVRFSPVRTTGRSACRSR